MYKTIVLMLVCFFCFLTSCRTTRQETQKNTLTTESYIKQKETYRDTVFFTQKTETSLKIPVTELAFKPGLNGVLKPKIFTQKNGNATAKIKILRDTIVVTATCDSLAIVAKIKSELQKEFNATARSDVANTVKSFGFSLGYLATSFVIGLVLGVVATIVFILKKYNLHEPTKYTV